MKTYPYPYHKGIIREFTREPLEKPPKPGLLPRPRQVCSIKYQWRSILGMKAQISIFPPEKYQRPARFERGCHFCDPLPIPLRALCKGRIVFDLHLELLVDVERVVVDDFINSLLNFVCILCIRQLVRGPQEL